MKRIDFLMTKSIIYETIKGGKIMQVANRVATQTAPVKEPKKMGRPRKPEYRSKQFRMAAIEDELLKVIQELENARDKEKIVGFLESLKEKANKK